MYPHLKTMKKKPEDLIRGNTVSSFVSPSLKLHNRYCHTFVEESSWELAIKSMEELSLSASLSRAVGRFDNPEGPVGRFDNPRGPVPTAPSSGLGMSSAPALVWSSSIWVAASNKASSFSPVIDQGIIRGHHYITLGYRGGWLVQKMAIFPYFM